MACNEQQKEELINKIMRQNEQYSRENVEKAVALCCNENDSTMEVENCAVERARTFHIMYPPQKS
jgi:hypothetical protein